MGSSTRWIYSSISPLLKQKALQKLLFFAVPAVFALILSAFFFTAQMHAQFGFPLFAGVLVLVTYGVKPYRKFCQLEVKPHKLGIDKEHLKFFSKGKLTLEIPVKHIEQLKYVENHSLYGIALYLKPFHSLNKDLSSWELQSQKHAKGCSLFFPYFRKEALEKLHSLF